MLSNVHTRYPTIPLFLAGVFFVVLAPVFWIMTELPPGQHIPRAAENAELYQQVYPAYHYGFGRLKGGELPLWNPEQFCGTPFLANPGHGVFQPLNAVFLLLPTERAMAVHAFLCLFLMGGLFVLFARALDAHFPPALLGGVVFAFSGAAAGAMSHPPMAATLAWTPLLFWGLREHIRARQVGPVVVAGLAAAFMILAGALLLAAAMLLLAAGYFLLSLVRPGEAWSGLWPRLRGIATVIAVAVGVSAVQWVPTLWWARDLADPWQALSGVLPLASLPARLTDLPGMLVAPGEGSLPTIAYFGVLGLVFVPSACLARRSWIEGVYFLLAGAGCLLLLASSGAWPATPEMRAALAYPAGFSLSVLTTLGAGRVLATGKEAGGFRHWMSIGLFLISLTALLFLGSNASRGVLVIVLLAACPVIAFRARWLGAMVTCALALLAFVELNNAAVNHYQHPYEDAPDCYARSAETLAMADEQALGGRVVISAHPRNPSLVANAGMISSVSCVGGYGPPLTDEARRWWRELSDGGPLGQLSPSAAHPELLNFMAARVLIRAEGGPLGASGFDSDSVPLRALRSADGLSLHANDYALPRAYWVPGWRVARDMEATIGLLTSPDFSGARECAVLPEGEGFEQLATLVPDAATAAAQPMDWESVECTVESDEPERVVLRVASPRPGVAILTDTFAPGWRATIDGRTAPILRVNGLFRGVAVPAGAHTITFFYRPWSFIGGLCLSLATLGLLVLLGLRSILKG